MHSICSDKERYRRRRETGKLKSVSLLSSPGKHIYEKKRWKVNQQGKRAKDRENREIQNYLSMNSPPESPDVQAQDNQNRDVPCARNERGGKADSIQTPKQRGRKKVNRNRRKVYHDLQKSQKKLENALQKVDKYRKRLDRLTKKHTTEQSPRTKARKQMRGGHGNLRRTHVFHNTLVSQLRQTYHQKKIKEKQIISKVIAGNILKKYRLVYAAHKELGISYKTMRKNIMTPGLQYSRKKHSNVVSNTTKEKIKEFLERDNNSRATTGKKDIITRQKFKKQKRYLNDSLFRLYQSFKEEYPQVKISYSKFCDNRPFWVVKPSIQDRDTCLCKTHANIQLMADKLLYLKVISTNRIENLMHSLCCESPTKACMYRECVHCQDKEVQTAAFEPGEQTQWMEWRVNSPCGLC